MAEAGEGADRLAERLEAIDSVRQVLHALRAIARAQLPRADAAAAEATVYLAWVDEVVERLVGPPRPGPAQGPTLHVLLGPERGYCGALPRQILAQAPAEGPLALVGRRLAEVAAEDPALLPRTRFVLPGAAGPEELDPAAEELASTILARAGDAPVALLHPIEGGHRLHRVLLLSGPREPARERPETWSPPEVVLRAAVAEALTGRLVLCLAEALRAEVRARLAAAEAAILACDVRREELDQVLRALRRERVTLEVLELAAARVARARSPGP